MKQIIMLMACMGMSASSFASIYSCGSLKYRGQMPAGGARYEIQTTSSSVYLYTSAGAPNNKPKKQVMNLVQAAGEQSRYSAGDLDAIFTYNIHTRKTDVTLQMASNKNWSTSCIENFPKTMPKR